MIQRATDAAFINRVLNDPEVRPWVADVADGVLDMTRVLETPGYLCLIGDHGGFVLEKFADGIWQVHTAILLSGRGQWAKDAAAACVRYMFTVTECIEILTRVPQGHVGAKALAEATGFRHQFTTPANCLFRGEKVPCHVYSLTIQEWFSRASEMEAGGAEFHAWLNKQVSEGEPHEPDPAHNRVVGVALAMILAGQVRKGIVWYNRCSWAARHSRVALLNENPPQIKFDAGVLTISNAGMRFERAH